MGSVTPSRIQLQRTKGWRKPEGAVVVARPSRWGNPFKVSKLPYESLSDARALAVLEYRAAIFKADMAVASGYKTVGETLVPSKEEIKQHLAGHDLACWCPLDQPCHADVLLELANQH